MIHRPVTLEQRLIHCHNRPSGFDYMRLILALSVVVTHTWTVTYGQRDTSALGDTWARYPITFILPMFFVLSGFLVMGSLERSKTLVSFLGLRLFRLVPALAVEVTICALIIGPIFTTTPLSSYFTSHDFVAYFLNIVGDVHFKLPGVFDGLPYPSVVNAQLWTLPWELTCYIALSALVLMNTTKRPVVFLILVVLLQIVDIVRLGMHGFPGGMGMGGRSLVIAFLFGAVLYRLRDRIWWSFGLFVAAFVVAIALISIPETTQFVSLPVAYITVYLGLTMPPRLRLVLSGDYSYGIFLFGFPIQQSVQAIFASNPNPWFNLMVSMVVILICAVASWHLVEKPVHDRRKVIFAIEDRIIDRMRAVPFSGILMLQEAAPTVPRPVSGPAI